MKTFRFYISLVLAVMAVSFVAQPAFAQEAAIDATLQADIDAAVDSGDTAALNALIANNPNARATIAQRAAARALTIAATNPTAAAAIAQAAQDVATELAVSNPAAAGRISAAAVQVANAPAVKANAPAAAAALAADVVEVTSTTAVANTMTVADQNAVNTAARSVATDSTVVATVGTSTDIAIIEDNTPVITEVDPNVVSPST